MATMHDRGRDMSTTSTRKQTKPSSPTWSKVGGGSGSARTSSAKPASAAKSQARPKTAAKPTRSGSKSAARKPQAPTAPPFTMPAHLQREMAGLLVLVIAILCMIGLVTWSRGGQGIVGVAGGTLAQLFGVAAWLVPLALAFAGLVQLMGARAETRLLSPLVPLGLLLLLPSLMGFLHLFADGQHAADLGQGGGWLGFVISSVLSDYLSKAGAGVVLLALVIAGFMLMFGISIGSFARAVGRPTAATGRGVIRAWGFASSNLSKTLADRRERQPAIEPVRLNGRPILDDTASLTVLEAPEHASPEKPFPPTARLEASHAAPTEIVNLLGNSQPQARPATAPEVKPALPKAKPEPVITMPPASKPATQSTDPQPMIPSPLGYMWQMPAVSLLDTTGEVKVSQADIKAKIKVIEETLNSFNVEATVREVNTGPAVTQFAIEPGVGVRVSRITTLDKDIALALAAPDIRIEAPIPGQSRIGIEVPNVSLQVVGLRSIMETDTFANHKGRLKIALGRDTHGQPVVTDLTKLPHILVAGATGSGKSVFLNSMVIGFLLQFTPDDLRMLMIDPKRVELTGFNGIPHLLRPVVTDVRMEKEPQVRSKDKAGVHNERERPLTAVEALKWALWEMERRYKLFAKGQKGKDGISKVFRNIEQYRNFTKDNPELSMEHLPYIVIIIDELADLMLTAPEEVETSLCRLAQLARATGIHLVVATQRPSVDVVTGLIKANFPARAAFAVTSQVDSKVILDGGGAEKLLGRGDMLYTASDESKPVRIQGTFVSDNESDRVVHAWRQQLPSHEELTDNGVQAPVKPMPMPDWLGTGDANEESELLEQAIELVKRTRYVSVSMLQRKLRVGYNRAARLVEQMEEMGLISPASDENRGKPREVLLGAPDDRALAAHADDMGEEAE